ncbi:hypothetical protein PGT21_016972 [Puccinia graminis f. sp. tritici]|uniref:Secreted protein n=1 Tax=Puccinia graminis f. sp. tritici TaxID=56615 RepID=A0A5B0PLD2_PUCGR|nr:hypothetical protein PGT21_016972 [Puccinia graminis f. sp. tritici]
MWIFGLYSLILLVGSINCAFGWHHGNPCLASSGVSSSLREHCCGSKARCKSVCFFSVIQKLTDKSSGFFRASEKSWLRIRTAICQAHANCFVSSGLRYAGSPPSCP